MKISTNWLKDFVELAPPVTRFADRLTMAGLEVKKAEAIEHPHDTLFEIEITSNRPDWLSHLGVAREIAAVENLSLKVPPLDPEAGRRFREEVLAIGNTRRPEESLRRFLGRDVVRRLVEEAAGLDVHIVSFDEPEGR